MSSAAAEHPPLVERARRGAAQTLCGGAAGALFGATKAYLASQPVAFMASAYGVNSLLFTGCFLGERPACGVK